MVSVRAQEEAVVPFSDGKIPKILISAYNFKVGDQWLLDC
jgi:hypothetical protein